MPAPMISTRFARAGRDLQAFARDREDVIAGAAAASSGGGWPARIGLGLLGGEGLDLVCWMSSGCRFVAIVGHAAQASSRRW